VLTIAASQATHHGSFHKKDSNTLICDDSSQSSNPKKSNSRNLRGT
jgi:hypothetical protein